MAAKKDNTTTEPVSRLEVLNTAAAGTAIATLAAAGYTAEAKANFPLAGAASVIFAVAPECRRLTGLDPTSDDAVETHANLVARLMVP